MTDPLGYRSFFRQPQSVYPQLYFTDPGTLQFSGRIKVLKEMLEHHMEEEEKEMFKEAAKLLSKDQLDELGEHMVAKQKKLKAAQK